MKITILTLFPEMFSGFLTTSIVKRALQDNKLQIELVNIRDYANNKHHHVDDYPFGGGAGMLMMVEPVVKAIRTNTSEKAHIILTSAQGQIFSQSKAQKLSEKEEIVIICGRYEGIDARVENYINEEISVGDYILTGGELPAMIIVDAVCRLVDEVIAKESLKNESFNEHLLEAPQYTKPVEFEGYVVPEVLISGHHENIRKWQKEKAIEVTKAKREDLFIKYAKEKGKEDAN